MRRNFGKDSLIGWFLVPVSIIDLFSSCFCEIGLKRHFNRKPGKPCFSRGFNSEFKESPPLSSLYLSICQFTRQLNRQFNCQFTRQRTRQFKRLFTRQFSRQLTSLFTCLFTRLFTCQIRVSYVSVTCQLRVS